MPDPAPTETAEPTALARLRTSLLRPSRGQAVAAVLLCLLAFAAVTQVRLTRTTDTYAGMRQSDLVQTLNGLSAAARRADAEITTLETTRDRLRSSTERRSAAVAQAREEVTTLGILAGTIPAIGPGVRITVTSPRANLTLNHLLDGIEELRDAGAEAMQINNTVRVVAQTSFQDATGGIAVDDKVLRSPYVIDAIGDPETLAKALNFPGGFKDDVTFNHEGTVQVRRLDQLEVGAVRVPTPARYAEPVSGG
jgi:uncharacterized protein YlxW (UPF0749 family)